MSEPTNATSGGPSSAQDAVEEDTTTSQPITRGRAYETNHRPDEGNGREASHEDPQDAAPATDTTAQPPVPSYEAANRLDDSPEGREAPKRPTLIGGPSDPVPAYEQPKNNASTNNRDNVRTPEGGKLALTRSVERRKMYEKNSKKIRGIVGMTAAVSPLSTPNKPVIQSGLAKSLFANSTGLSRLAWNRRRIFIVLQRPETVGWTPSVPIPNAFEWRIVITPKSHTEKDRAFNQKLGLLTFSCRGSGGCNGIPKFEHLPLGMEGLIRLAAMILIAKIPPKVTLLEIKALLQQVQPGPMSNGPEWAERAMVALQRAGIMNPDSLQALEKFANLLTFEHLKDTPNKPPAIGNCLKGPLLNRWGALMAKLPDGWRIGEYKLGQLRKLDKMDAKQWEDEGRVQLGKGALGLLQSS
ncbi:hypothetical protein FQN50_004541 [Emmonsiellopsis sp. PD_5]|nr:hypothetical protein FQN50_004541 [Emmonsiellopsis sp. PD_5]